MKKSEVKNLKDVVLYYKYFHSKFNLEGLKKNKLEELKFRIFCLQFGDKAEGYGEVRSLRNFINSLQVMKPSIVKDFLENAKNHSDVKEMIIRDYTLLTHIIEAQQKIIEMWYFNNSKLLKHIKR